MYSTGVLCRLNNRHCPVGAVEKYYWSFKPWWRLKIVLHLRRGRVSYFICDQSNLPTVSHSVWRRSRLEGEVVADGPVFWAFAPTRKFPRAPIIKCIHVGPRRSLEDSLDRLFYHCYSLFPFIVASFLDLGYFVFGEGGKTPH